MANRLTEILKKSISGIRVKPNVGREYDSAFDPDDELSKSLMDNSSNSSVIDNINTFREMSRNRNEQYDAFDEMEKDATISAALKMYADDATQYNLDGNVIWVESDDPNIAEFGNRLIEVLRLNESAWSHIYQLVKYGDLYLETFYDDESSTSKMNSKSISGGFGTAVQYHKIGARIDEYIEAVPNPASIFDLRKRGKVAGFIKIDDVDPEKTNYSRVYSVNLTGTTQQILPSDKYVHIMISAESSRYPETLNIEYKDKDGNDVNESYRVAKGKSMLADTFKSFRELKLMEDSILLNRVTRSPLTRILQVEVGDMSKAQIREKLRQIKRMIEQKNFLDKDSGEFSNMASPGPVDNIVYVPTRDGKGAITSTTLGGDVDPKSLVDIEYYKQKEAGGLGIPLSYLQQQSGDGGGLSSGTALTKLDNRYARAVKRIQTAYCAGIQTLLNIFAIRKGLTDYVNNFKVRMLSPSTIEDADRDEQLDNRIRMTNDMLSIIDNFEGYNDDTKRQVIEYLISVFLNKPEITNILSKQEAVSEDEPVDDSDGYEMSSGEGSSVSNNFFGDDISQEPSNDFNFDEALPLESTSDEETSVEEPSESSDFGDFEEFA